MFKMIACLPAILSIAVATASCEQPSPRSDNPSVSAPQIPVRATDVVEIPEVDESSYRADVTTSQPSTGAAPPSAATIDAGNPMIIRDGSADVVVPRSAAGETAGGSGPLSGMAAGTDQEADNYPPLDASMIGAPVKLDLKVTPPLSLAEGPLWDPCEHKLLFVDVNASAIYQMGEDNAVSVFASKTNRANGIAFDIDGTLVMAQMGSGGHIGRRDKSGTIKAIEPPGGPKLNTPDDVIVRSDGTIYFTDYGALTPLPVYQYSPMGKSLINGGTVLGPNGVELSPDETTLYVAGYNEGTIWTFAVSPDGTLTKNLPFARGLSNPDSLCLDAAGDLYVGTSSGLQVFRPDGSKVKLIPATSFQGTTNCTFGGEDGRTLFITAWTVIYKVEAMPIPGLDWVVNRTRLGCK